MSPHNSEEPNGSGPGRPFLPPLDFSSIVAPFYVPALIKLGVLNDPVKGEPDVDLAQARRLIDLLDLLSDRTRGRLEPDEEKYLETILSELKMHFLEKSEAVKI